MTSVAQAMVRNTDRAKLVRSLRVEAKACGDLVVSATLGCDRFVYIGILISTD